MTSVLLWVIFMSQKGTWAHMVTFEREGSLPPLSLVWAELVLCILVVDLCCSRAPVSSHKLLKSTDRRVASLCGVVHDWGEVPLTVLGSRTLSTHGNLERVEVSQHSHEPLYFLPSRGVIRQQKYWNFVSCLLGGKVSSWTYLLGWPSFPGLCTPHIRLLRWVTDVVQASFSFFLLFFPFSIFLWIIWQGDGLICLEALFWVQGGASQPVSGCKLEKDTAPGLMKPRSSTAGQAQPPWNSSSHSLPCLGALRSSGQQVTL